MVPQSPPDENLSTGPPAPGEEARDALDAVMTDQAERELRRSQPHRPQGGSRQLLLLVLTTMLCGTAWIFFARPDAFQPPPLPQPTSEALAAGLRMDIYVAALEVESYREEVGGLPTTLVEALEDPESAADLVYEIVEPDAFRISGRRGAEEASFLSTEPAAEFLASARQVLEGGRK